MVEFTIDYIEALLKKYGKQFPRKSKLKQFDEVNARAAALSNLNVAYHQGIGFLGFKVKLENKRKGS